MLSVRTSYVIKGDPRPIPNCSWCGPKWSEKRMNNGILKSKDKNLPSCVGCKLLYKEGWRMHGYVRKKIPGSKGEALSVYKNNGERGKVLSIDYRWSNPRGKSFRSVKSFLAETTHHVAEEVKLIIMRRKNGIGSSATDDGGVKRSLDEVGGDVDDDNDGIKEQHRGKKIKSRASQGMKRRDHILHEHDDNKNTVSVRSDDDQQSSDDEQNGTRSSSTKQTFDTEKNQQQSSLLDQQLPPPKRLPTMEELLNEEQGLYGILSADEFQTWRWAYGDSMNIAVQILERLIQGKLPHQVQMETPIFKPQEELNTCCPTGGPPPARFYGVTRIMEQQWIPSSSSSPSLSTNDKDNPDNEYDDQTTPQQQHHVMSSHPKGTFGVEFPMFIIHNTTSITTTKNKTKSLQSQSTIPSSLPKPAMVKGRKVILRNDLTREDIAGQLYSFVYRLLYGHAALSNILVRTNYNGERDEGGKEACRKFVNDALKAFGATRKQDQEG